MNDGCERELDELMLERLVDGELTDAEYQALLASLDQRPDGWRRCALAFLEDQAWGREVRGFRRQLDEPIERVPVSRLRWSWKFGGILTLASAASFLLMYVVATSVMQSRLPSSDTQFNLAATADHSKQLPEGASSAMETPHTASPWGEYQLVVDNGGEPQPVQMPIFAADDPRASLLFNERASMPWEIMRDLRKAGYQVDRQRQWALGEDGGNSVLVPVEELQITPISGRSYQ